MRTARNVAIILALGAVVAFVPGGGNASDTVFAAMGMAFLSLVALSIYVYSRQQPMLLDSLTDTSRIVLYSGLGLIVLLIAGASELLGGSPGSQLIWLVLLGAAIAAIWRVWVEATNYQ